MVRKILKPGHNLPQSISKVDLPKDIVTRIANKTLKTTTCWLWTGNKNKDGYGIIQISNKQKRVTRVVFAIVHGQVTNNQLVLHSCDNPTCINPIHLYSGTPADNVRDEVSRGRIAQGSRNNQNKLTEIQVLEIRSLHKEGSSLSKLGRKFAVSHKTIESIVKRKTWKWLLDKVGS